MTNGRSIDLDVIICATGFHTNRFVRPITVTGRNGMDLDTVWGEKPTAYYAISVPDFPNLFLLNGPTSPVGNFSLIEIAEKQWHYIDQLVSLLRHGKAREVSAKQSAVDEYDLRRIEAAKTTVFAAGCDSWYLDEDGVPQTWPWSQARFDRVMSSPDLRDFEVV